MVNEAIDFRFLLIDNYKKLKLSEVEVATIFVMRHLIDQGNPMITADLLSLKMTLSVQEIDKVLTGLLQKGMIDYVSVNKTTVTTLDPLVKKLYREFQLAMNVENEAKANKHVENQLSNVFEQFQSLLGRGLSPLEISKIREWVSFGYSDKLIIDALKEALSKNKKSLRSVDKILLTWQQRNDLEKEGHTIMDENWRKNIEETIKIAQTPWVDNNDDDED